MLRKIVFVIIALALPLAAASAAAAQQYPPTGDGPAGEEVSPGGGDPDDEGADPSADSEGAGAAPLARTGSEIGLMAGIAVVLLAGGALTVMASRRGRQAPTPA